MSRNRIALYFIFFLGLIAGSAGKVALAAGIEPASLPGQVVDDAQAEVQGEWTASTSLRPFVGQGYRYSGPEKRARAVFRPRVVESGVYHVLAAYTPHSNRAEKIPYIVATSDGPQTVVVNQREKPSYARIFISLGEFTLAAGEVEITIDAAAASEGVVIIDAVAILTAEEFAELKKNSPVDKPQLAVKAPAGNSAEPAKKEEPVVEKAAPFQRLISKTERRRLSSQQLDELLAAASGLVESMKPCDDLSFLRRVSLDLIGRPPTPEEMATFAADGSADKRAKRVDELLASPEFGANWANYWSDVISYRTPQPELTFLNYGPFKSWLAGEINSGRRWDEIVYQIITAGGKVGENPSATFIGFHQADRSRLASETTRVFLSTQIQCAECHNHKFIELKQETFHHVAAYFARVEAKLPWNDSQLIEVKSRSKGEHRMPGGKDDMSAAAFGERTSEPGASDMARRTELAIWLTGPDNPWFAKAFVNRVWARTMGRGFSEPVDEIGELGNHVLPEMFTAVADHFVATEFDVRDLFRTIVLSQAYQRPLAETPRGWVKPFSIVSPGRLRGDEVFESLARAIELPNVTPEAVKPTDAVRFPPPPKSTRDLVNEAFGIDPSLAAEHVSRTMQQVMFMMNNLQLQKQVDGSDTSGTVLARLLHETDDDDIVTRRLYQRVLARTPSERELEIAREHVARLQDRRAAFEDLQWSLLNSAEFVSRR